MAAASSKAIEDADLRTLHIEDGDEEIEEVERRSQEESFDDRFSEWMKYVAGVFQDRSGRIRYHPGTEGEIDLVYLFKETNRDVWKDRRACYYKIGHSSNISKRYETLQTGNPRTIRLICACPGGKEFETQLHEYFRNCKHKNEWFCLNKGHLELLKEQMLKRLPILDYSISEEVNDQLVVEMTSNRRRAEILNLHQKNLLTSFRLVLETAIGSRDIPLMRFAIEKGSLDAAELSRFSLGKAVRSILAEHDPDFWYANLKEAIRSGNGNLIERILPVMRKIIPDFEEDQRFLILSSAHNNQKLTDFFFKRCYPRLNEDFGIWPNTERLYVSAIVNGNSMLVNKINVEIAKVHKVCHLREWAISRNVCNCGLIYETEGQKIYWYQTTESLGWIRQKIKENGNFIEGVRKIIESRTFREEIFLIIEMELNDRSAILSEVDIEILSNMASSLRDRNVARCPIELG